MRFISTIIDSEVKFMSVTELRNRIVSQIRGKGVDFKDLEKFLLKEARREGYYQTEEELEEARKAPKAWIVYTDRFIVWCQKRFTSKWEVKTVKKNPPKGSKEVDVVSRKPLTPKRAENLLNIPENVKALEEAFIKKGVVVVDEESFDDHVADQLVENAKVLNVLLKALKRNGYKVR